MRRQREEIFFHDLDQIAGETKNRDFGSRLAWPELRFFYFGDLIIDFKNSLRSKRKGQHDNLREVKQMRRLLKNREGQSTLEYVVVLTAIIAAVVLAVPTIKQKVQASFEHAAGEMEEQVNKIDY